VSVNPRDQPQWLKVLIALFITACFILAALVELGLFGDHYP
jgi:hypothetical protein